MSIVMINTYDVNNVNNVDDVNNDMKHLYIYINIYISLKKEKYVKKKFNFEKSL